VLPLQRGVLLHCCYTVVTLLLHCCYTVVTLLSHCCCYTVVTRSHCCCAHSICTPIQRPVMMIWLTHAHAHTHAGGVRQDEGDPAAPVSGQTHTLNPPSPPSPDPPPFSPYSALPSCPFPSDSSPTPLTCTHMYAYSHADGAVSVQQH
jgi:hypothetical protein